MAYYILDIGSGEELESSKCTPETPKGPPLLRGGPELMLEVVPVTASVPRASKLKTKVVLPS